MGKLWLLLAPLMLIGAAHAEPAKLVTDDVVKKEMTTIRDLTVNAYTLVTHRRMPPADARAYHGKIKASVERIKADTQMTGEAREEIVKLAGYIERGAGAVAGSDPMEAMDGMLIVDDSLTIYAQRFEHPDWKPLR
ncbi:hypothetical protein W911_10780 [Hyphomicrobium nitrativorans NL23]|uniref:Uncharacterized protein n=1 Tax=Hyphomicrobium nitrativorans NL23 TaxID=1029756 RepID=V5SJD1_9HYPH|nr:hypothetical protein [Hyphomicrobium nitrativorans]AHB50200.1 hypothetical protein W911_10780 [Hyphomicrobium nitrativorans NL23]